MDVGDRVKSTDKGPSAPRRPLPPVGVFVPKGTMEHRGRNASRRDATRACTFAAGIKATKPLIEKHGFR